MCVSGLVLALLGSSPQEIALLNSGANSSPHFRVDLRHCDQLAQNLTFPLFLQVITSSGDDFIQHAICSFQARLADLLASFNITPTTIGGQVVVIIQFSNAAGVLTVLDILYRKTSKPEFLKTDVIEVRVLCLLSKPLKSPLLSCLETKGMRLPASLFPAGQISLRAHCCVSRHHRQRSKSTVHDFSSSLTPLKLCCGVNQGCY